MAKSTPAKAKKTSSRTAAPKKSAAKSAAKKSTKAKAASRTAKAKPSKAKKADDATGDQDVTIDRRRQAERRTAESVEAAPAKELKPRKKVNRRRQIDPTTCERDYSDQEVEFMNALDEYKRASGRMFPTCSEVLEVIRSLGYAKLSAAEIAARPADEQPGEVFAGDAIPQDEQGEEAELEEAFA